MSENRGVGRPKLPEDEKLISINLRLTPRQVAWMNYQVELRRHRDRPSRSDIAREAFSLLMEREGEHV